MLPDKPVAVTGMGCICAAGADLEAGMATLFHGQPQPKGPTRFTADHPAFHPAFELEPAILSKLPRDPMLSLTTALGIAAAGQALTDAGFTPEALGRLTGGVCMGTTVGCTLNAEAFYRTYRAGEMPDLSPVLRFIRSNPAESIAGRFALKGPCRSVVNACCSGTDAIGMGASWIRRGICDVVLAGGTDALSRVTYNGFISLMITDSEPCRPFDRHRKGLTLGEGAAVMVLESERSRALREKAARAFVRGYGAAADAFHLTAPRPDGAGLRKAVAEALRSSSASAPALAFVGAHGTGTRDNDRVEAHVLHTLLPGVPFFSTKGHTGHTLGAAGAIQAVFVAACLLAEKIPVSAGFREPDPELPAGPNTTVRTIHKTLALSQSLAFGGNKSVLLLERGEAS